MTDARHAASLIVLTLLLVTPSLVLAVPQDEVTPKPNEEKKDKDEEDDELELGGRVHVGFDAEHFHDESNEWDDTFHIRRARLEVTWNPEDWLTAEIQMDVAPLYYGLGMNTVKDAYIQLKPFDQLEVRFGHFKRPFSGLELTSSGKLKVIERGIANDELIDGEFGGMCYGDRDIGLELAGRLVESVRLEYALGVFNGAGPGVADFDNAKDLVARLSIRPVKPLTFGASGAFKFYDDSMREDGYPQLAAAAEADVGIKVEGFRAHLEGLIAHNYERFTSAVTPFPDVGDIDLAFGALGILSYKFEIPSSVELALEPVVKVEYFDPNDRIIDDHVMLYTVGFNTYVGEYFRVMLDFEIMRAERFWDLDPERDDPGTPALEDVTDHQERLLLLVCFDI